MKWILTIAVAFCDCAFNPLTVLVRNFKRFSSYSGRSRCDEPDDELTIGNDTLASFKDRDRVSSGVAMRFSRSVPALFIFARHSHGFYAVDTTPNRPESASCLAPQRATCVLDAEDNNSVALFIDRARPSLTKPCDRAFNQDNRFSTLIARYAENTLCRARLYSLFLHV